MHPLTETHACGNRASGVNRSAQCKMTRHHLIYHSDQSLLLWHAVSFLARDDSRRRRMGSFVARFTLLQHYTDV